MRVFQIGVNVNFEVFLFFSVESAQEEPCANDGHMMRKKNLLNNLAD